MNKTLLTIIIAVIVLIGGFFSYKTYKHTSSVQMQQNSITQEQKLSPSINPTTTADNSVDQTSSPQEQQVQQNLNSLDSSDTQ
ncbi:MAG TPA: hypothetical protein VF820_04465 [Patescibacteria group bacterium]